jgi:DNA-damage-inducible protein D
VDGKTTKDYKLSRFACYLVAMNGDVKKPAVAAAQAYFATLAEAARRYVQNARDVERVQIRDEMSGREKSLVTVAKNAGVEQYQFFQNAGYRGMYNMNFNDLKRAKGIPDEKRSLLDFMDKRELAANLFRITETEAKLKSDQIHGQRPAELAATEVGHRVRKMMIDTDGTKPEDLPLTSDIKEVRAGLKKAAKEFVQIDGAKPTRKKLPPPEGV